MQQHRLQAIRLTAQKGSHAKSIVTAALVPHLGHELPDAPLGGIPPRLVVPPPVQFFGHVTLLHPGAWIIMRIPVTCTVAKGGRSTIRRVSQVKWDIRNRDGLYIVHGSIYGPDDGIALGGGWLCRWLHGQGLSGASGSPTFSTALSAAVATSSA